MTTITLLTRLAIRPHTHKVYIENYIKEINKINKYQPNFIRCSHQLNEEYDNVWARSSKTFHIYEFTEWKVSSSAKKWLLNDRRKRCLNQFNPFISEVENIHLKSYKPKEVRQQNHYMRKQIDSDILLNGVFLGY